MDHKDVINSGGSESKRSRSLLDDGDGRGNIKRHRSASPHQHSRHRRHRESSPKAKLPFRAHHLHRHDLESYKPLFAEYLDIQKHLDIEQLHEDEVKGRWKSFLNKWNRGELAEGWYDPEMRERADERSAKRTSEVRVPKISQKKTNAGSGQEAVSVDEDDGYGPSLPSAEGARQNGPTVPNLQDLQYRQELAEDDREAHIADLRYERKQDRMAQKERLEELAPRAAPGSRERQMEKKRDAAASNRTFAEAKEAGAEEVGESDLMGDNGIDGYKVRVRDKEKRKNEREVRKEEVLRARAAEREERMKEHRRKEEKTMDMLKSLAQQRYGGGA